MPIPKVIHQLWKDDTIPERYRALRDGWRRLNPGWEQRLWTDRDLLALVETRYPDWLPIYASYRRAISRADLGRYLVLREFGGVYADLDCECLKPIEPLLNDATYAIGLEPAAHNRYYGVDRVICISFIASTPRHAFWEVVLSQVRASVGEADVLAQTGPLLMNRAYETFAAKDTVRLLPAEQVYPFTDEEARGGQAYDIEIWERATRGAYVAHFWDGTWFRAAAAPMGLPIEIPASVNAVEAQGDLDPTPRISCLMVSGGRLEAARRAIDDFLRQTYANCELVIGAAAPDAALVDHLRALGRADVRLVALPEAPAADRAPLDPILVDAAEGEAACAWEEDSLHDPRRLEIQQQIRLATRSRACLMRRQLIWQPRSGRIGVGATRPVARSILGDMADMRLLTARAIGESAWLDGLAGAVRTAAFDLPRLMLRIDEEDDRTAAEAFDAEWRAASTRFPADRTEAVLAALAARLAIPVQAAAVAPQTSVGRLSTSSL